MIYVIRMASYETKSIAIHNIISTLVRLIDCLYCHFASSWIVQDNESIVICQFIKSMIQQKQALSFVCKDHKSRTKTSGSHKHCHVGQLLFSWINFHSKCNKIKHQECHQQKLSKNTLVQTISASNIYTPYKEND